jgi:ankyrin repeat protein
MSDKSLDAGHGKLIDAVLSKDMKALSDALGQEDVNGADIDGWTALHIAAREGNAEATQLLLGQPTISVDAKNRWKSTPLMIAAGSGSLTIVDLLLHHPRTQIDLQAEYYGRTALIEAAVKGHISVVKALVSNGANVNVTDKTGRNSALIEAMKNGHFNVATYLLRSGLVDFSDRDLRLQALIWCGNRGGDVLRSELDTAINRFFEQNHRAVS